MYIKKLIFLVVFFILIKNTMVYSQEIKINVDPLQEGINLLKNQQYDKASYYHHPDAAL